MTYAVNVLAPFLLTALVHDIVTSKIVNTASLSAAGSLDVNNLNQERGFRYCSTQRDNNPRQARPGALSHRTHPPSRLDSHAPP